MRRRVISSLRIFTERRLRTKNMISKRNRPMDCKEFKRLTPEWLNDELVGRTAYKFIDHIDSCSECREELHIQFLVKEGTARLESGAGFNLDKELAIKVEQYRRFLKRRDIINRIVYAMEAIAVAAIVFILILVFTRGRF